MRGKEYRIEELREGDIFTFPRMYRPGRVKSTLMRFVVVLRTPQSIITRIVGCDTNIDMIYGTKIIKL